jgi:hypothetical protein
MIVKFKNKRFITGLWKAKLSEFNFFLRFFETNRVGESLDDDPALSLWVSDQRVLFFSGQLTKQEHVKLENKNFLFKVENKTESELQFTLESIVRKLKIEDIDSNEKFKDVSVWLKKKELLMSNDIDMYDSSPINDNFLRIMVLSKKIKKSEIKIRKIIYVWNQKCDSVNDLMFNKKERIIKSKYPIEQRWIIYHMENKEKLNNFQIQKFSNIENQYKEIVETEKKFLIEKKTSRDEQLKKDPLSTTYKFKSCNICSNNVYSLRGECVKCVAVRDKESKIQRKNKDIVVFNARVAAQTAKRKANKLQATPKWLTKEDHSKIENFYIAAQIKSKVNEEEYHVDHIIPLVGKDYVKMNDGSTRYIQVVCGLHTPENMQVIKGLDNKSKQARFNLSSHDENKHVKDAKKQIRIKL